MLISACINTEGFNVKPLYSTNTQQKIKAVYIASIDGENGVYLHNVLAKGVSTGNNPKYRLQSKIEIDEKNLAIGTDNSITRKQITTKIYYQLVDIKNGGNIVHKFSTFGFANYSSSATPHITEVSRQHAIRRALSIAGNSGVLRLGHIFENGIVK